MLRPAEKVKAAPDTAPPACLLYNDPYRDNGVSQNDAVIYAVEILLSAGNFAILSGWLCDLSRNGFRLIGNAVPLHQQPGAY